MKPKKIDRTPDITRFIPTTMEEVRQRGWENLEVILVSGDTYIDSPHIGVAVIARVLLNAGFRVGIIAQPDINDGTDISRLGEPVLFWGVTAGSVDSMIANTTAGGKPRRKDDLTPGGENTRRPDRASISYSNLIRRYFKNTAPIVLGGIEASLRRISHYDAWSDKVRRSILFDAKADYLLYGMAERSIVELAHALSRKQKTRHIRGLCYIDAQPPGEDGLFDKPDIELPGHRITASDKDRFSTMFSLFYANSDPVTAGRLYQQQDTRYLVHNPPQLPLSPDELDAVYELPFTHEVHPRHAAMGPVPAMETIRFSLTTHRGCFGECRFCAISVHQGRQVVSRSRQSLIREAAGYTRHPLFKGIISNVGGPTANMYAMTCSRISAKGACPDKSCLFPEPCRLLRTDHRPQIELLQELREIAGVRKVFVGSGLRHDLIAADSKQGRRYLEEILVHHASGQLKLAPEHVTENILNLMGKPGHAVLEQFLKMFELARKKSPHPIFLTYYLMAAHPGCTIRDMLDLREFALQTLKILPEQVQIFTPSPSTYSTLMYYTEKDPFTGRKIKVEKNIDSRRKQKEVMSKAAHRGKGERPFK